MKVWHLAAALVAGCAVPSIVHAQRQAEQAAFTTLDAAIEQASQRLVVAAGATIREGVAVLPFPHDDELCSGLSIEVAELLTDALVNANGSGARVVERRRLQQLIADNQLGQRLNDPETQRRLGGLAAVRLLGTGTISPGGQTVRIVMRLIDTQTGIVQSSSQFVIRREIIADQIARSVGRGAGCEAASITSSPDEDRRRISPNAAPVVARLDQKGLRLTMTNIFRPSDGNALRVRFSLTNTTTSPLGILVAYKAIGGATSDGRRFNHFRLEDMRGCDSDPPGSVNYIDACLSAIRSGQANITILAPNEEITFGISEFPFRAPSEYDSVLSLTLPILVNRAPGSSASRNSEVVSFSFQRIGF